LLLPERCKDTLWLVEAAYGLALDLYGHMYAGTIHAGLAFVRCPVVCGEKDNLQTASLLMDKLLAANSISRFGT